MKKKYRIKVTVAIHAKTSNASHYVIEKDYEREGSTLGECRINAENQAMKDWEISFCERWQRERKAAGKETAFTATCLEYNIAERY